MVTSFRVPPPGRYLAALLLCSAACRPHVALTVPGRDAPSAERLTAYQQLRPYAMQRTRVTSSRGSYTTTDFLELDNGERIYHVADILPLVDAQSDAAQSAHRAQKFGAANRHTFLGALGTLVLGSVVMIASASSHHDAGESSLGPGFFIGLGLVGGSLLGVPIGNYFGSKANSAAAEAYGQYETGLRQKLNLCLKGAEVVPCP